MVLGGRWFEPMLRQPVSFAIEPGADAACRQIRRPGRVAFRAMFKSTIKFGSFRGIALGANWSWLIVVGLITWSLAAGVFPQTNKGLSDATYIGMALVAAMLFFGSLLLHELGHAVQAEREGMRVEGITLWIFGGVAKFTGMFPSAGAEFRIAVAGPLVTVVIATLSLGLSALLRLPDPVDGVIVWIGTMNVVLLIFNMLPAFPLDGGRVLRSALWARSGDFSRSTQVAGAIGKGFGQFLMAGGVMLLILTGIPSGIWLSLIGWFLVTAAQAESQLVQLRDAFAGRRVTDLMVRDPQTVAPGISLLEFAERVYPGHRYNAYPVVDESGLTVGILAARAVNKIPATNWATTPVSAAMLPLEHALAMPEGKELPDAVTELVQTELGRALILRDQRLVGLLSVTDVQRSLALRVPGGRDVALTPR